MSVGNSKGLTKNLLDLELSQAGVETDNALIFEKNIRELEAYLTREADMKDSTDGAFNLLLLISDPVQKEFDELISGDSDKKHFLWALSTIFGLLLDTKVGTAEKIKRILKITIETTIKMLQE